MKRVALAVLLLLSLAVPALAQTPPPAPTPASYPLWSPARLSVGGRIYNEFDELNGVAGQYGHEWRVGLPLAWQITGLDDPRVTFPISLTGAIDYGITNTSGHPLRLQIGATVLFKKAGQ